MCLIALHTLRLQATRHYKYELVDCVGLHMLVVICCKTQGNFMAEAAEQIYFTLTKQCMYNEQLFYSEITISEIQEVNLKVGPRPTQQWLKHQPRTTALA